MGKSARVLGRDLGRTAAETNQLLKEHGYLEGEPNAYKVTEKGKPFATERHITNGVGGYSHYQVNYEVRTWNDDLLPALLADMEARAGRQGERDDVALDDGAAETAPGSLEPRGESWDDDNDSDEEHALLGGAPDADDSVPDVSGKQLLVAVAVVVGGLMVWRYGPPAWNNHVKPKLVALREKLLREERSLSGEPQPEEAEPQP